MHKNEVKPLNKYRKNGSFIRYAKEIPGERVQMDVCKITTGRYQYTAIEDCSRFRVLALYTRRTAKNSINFLERVVEQMTSGGVPLPIQRVQTDRGQEFFAYSFQEKLKEYCIKFRPIKPCSPHLNGKVERSQQTDLQEFYYEMDLTDKKLPLLVEEWQFHYNWYRPHSSLNNKTPMDVVVEKSALTPFWEDIEAKYDESKEKICIQSYKKEKNSLHLSNYTKAEVIPKNILHEKCNFFSISNL
ncbi:integrase core domain-containing protein [Emticicia oligotrophica]|uniref:integrase core domain-containing protein n=1 Tax=Emticicia oligotrophica TaxID=312279 RepID=UPI00273AAFEE|nr:integrase core domain-containing protein [Emticicia oligotrophica]